MRHKPTGEATAQNERSAIRGPFFVSVGETTMRKQGALPGENIAPKVLAASGAVLYLFGYAVKIKSFACTMVWQANPHLASFSCGGESDAVAGENESVAVS